MNVLQVVCMKLLAVIIAVSLISPAMAFDGYNLPESYALPEGLNPEGITRKGKSSKFFVGSLADGSIFQFDALTGEGEFVIEGREGSVAVGMDFDPRSGLLYGTGKITIYDPSQGELVREFDVGTNGEESFVNDVIVTKRAVFFTDSRRTVFYKIKLKKSGKLSKKAALKTIAIQGDFNFVAGAFNSNGIEADYAGKQLIIANTQAQKLYRVDAKTGESVEILMDQTLPNADGLLLFGNKLFVVQNFVNQISVVQLNRHATTAEVVKTITNSGFDIPTTTANFGLNLLVVNARFGTADAVEFSVQRIDLLAN